MIIAEQWTYTTLSYSATGLQTCTGSANPVAYGAILLPTLTINRRPDIGFGCSEIQYICRQLAIHGLIIC